MRLSIGKKTGQASRMPSSKGSQGILQMSIALHGSSHFEFR